MLNERQKIEFNALRFEIIDLNISAYFYIRKTNRLSYILKKTTREYFIEELTALRYLENGIILHLTNLDDDKAKYSFRSVKAIISATSRSQIDVLKLNKELQLFRQHVNDVKVKHRNSRIAHLNSEDFMNIDEFLNFEMELKPLILEANRIADHIWGENINVKYKLGSSEGVIDFKSVGKDLKVNHDANTGFA